MVTWDDCDGFETGIRALLTGGLSGISLNHTDSGGYTSLVRKGVGYVRSRGLLLRWLEASAFTVVYRTHEGNQPDVNAQIYTDAGTYDQFARMAKVYASLGFYRQVLFREAATRGRPVVRHPLLHYPDDETLRTMHTQFMLGSEFLVAPIVDRCDDRREVYLPAGAWTHVWSGDRYDAGWHTMVAPVGEPPAFHRADSTIGRRFRANLHEWGVL
jgi:alpha-glucosidase